jgi:hypothetical protein
LRDVDGFFAVLLWDEYQKNGNPNALDTLLAYNVQDTITLENLMVTAYNMKLNETPFFNNLLIEESTPPVNPLSVDLTTIDRIKSNSQYWASGQWY